MPQQTYSITAPNGKTLDVTGDHMPTETELHDIFAKAGVDTAAAPPSSAGPSTPGDAGGIATAVTGAALPSIAHAAESFATSPAVPKAAAAVGRVLGAVAPVAGGAYELGPSGALLAIPGMAKGSWAGGKTGWFTGKMAQNVAAPVAAALEKAEPYAQALSTVGGAQGLLDLVQMADPKRKDLGFLGVSLNDPHDPEHPALVNAAMNYVLSKLDGWQWSKMKNLVMQKGLDEIAAVKQVLSK